MIAIASNHDTTESGVNFAPPTLSRTNPPSVKTSRMKWPANILAKSRTESVNGRMMKFDRNSSGITIGRMYPGAPAGTVMFRRNLPTPCRLIPR